MKVEIAAAPRSELVHGLTRGLLLGVLAASVEALWLTLASRAWLGAERFLPQPATALAATLALYVPLAGAWGLLVGVAARGARRWIPAEERRARIERALVLALPLAFVWHATADGWPDHPRWSVACWLAIAVAAPCLAELAAAPVRAVLAAWLGPWTACSLLFGVGWVLAVPLAGRRDGLVLVGASISAAAIVALARALRARRPAAAPLAAAPILALAALAWLASGTLRAAPWVANGVGRAQSSGPGQPSVLLVVLDTTRADHLPDWGYSRDTTPHLAALGQQALRFQRAVAPSDLTLPSHASLFTGFYPPAHGAFPTPGHPRGRPLDARRAVLAEILASLGLRTYAVIANHGYLGREYGLERGFEHYDARPAVPPLAAPPPHSLRQRALDAWKRFLPESCFHRTWRRADAIADETLALIEDAHARRERWFLFANLMDAHAPYDPPEPYASLFPGRDAGFGYQDFQDLSDAVNAGGAAPDAAAREHLVSQYDGGIAFMDAELGRIFARLVELGEWERTIVVVTSDHGEAFGEHDTLNHSVSVYEEQVHVPLWFKPAGRSKGKVVHSRVSLVDVLPSLLEALDVEPPPELHGRSFLRQVADPKRVVFAENVATESIARLGRRFAGADRAAYYGAKKLVLRSDGRSELYDLLADPGEERPDTDRGTPIARRLIDELDRYVRGAGFGRTLPPPELAAGAFRAPPQGYVR